MLHVSKRETRASPCFCLAHATMLCGTLHIISSWVKGDNLPLQPCHAKRQNLITHTCFVFNSLTGNFSTITVTFSFQRRIGYYALQVYLPDVFVVALSWIVFWMDKTEMGDRMALGITTILTIMFLLGSLNSSMPRVSYAKALDWYLLVSFIFVFLSLIECMLVFILTMKCSKKTKPTTQKVSF